MRSGRGSGCDISHYVQGVCEAGAEVGAGAEAGAEAGAGAEVGAEAGAISPVMYRAGAQRARRRVRSLPLFTGQERSGCGGGCDLSHYL